MAEKNATKRNKKGLWKVSRTKKGGEQSMQEEEKRKLERTVRGSRQI
jgi:hypothetical protein